MEHKICMDSEVVILAEGDGIVTKGVEATIRNVGRLGRDGMRQTDKEIVKIMLHR